MRLSVSELRVLVRPRTLTIPPSVSPPTDETDIDELAARFAELITAIRQTGTPAQVQTFETRLGRRLQADVHRFLSGVAQAERTAPGRVR